MLEESYRDQVAEHIPKQCRCLAAAVLASAVAKQGCDARVNIDDAVDKLESILDPSCQGTHAEDFAAAGCKLETVCNDTRGAEFLLGQVAAVHFP